METTLATMFFGNPSNPLQTSSQGANDTGKDPQLFLSVLKQTMKGKAEAAEMGTTEGKGTTETKTSTTDDLAKSLDIIDALAFLPVLLAAQAQNTAAANTSGEGQAYSGETISGLLDAITRALETGNALDVQKALEGDPNLRTLLSGRAETGSRGLSSGSGSSSLGALLKNAQTAGQTGSGGSTDGSLASILAALLSGSDTTATASPAGDQKETAGPTSSAEGEKKAETPTAQGQSSGTTDDAVRDTMLLGAVLPNLLSAKSGEATEETAASQSDGTGTKAGIFALNADILKAAGAKGSAAVKSENSSASQNQANAAAKPALSEDYVLLNETTNTQEKDGAAKAFEVLFRNAEATQSAADAKTVSPLASVVEEVTTGDAVASDRNATASLRGSKARHGAGQEQARAGITVESASFADASLSEETVATNTTDPLIFATEKTGSEHGKGDVKPQSDKTQADSATRKNDAFSFTSDNQASTSTSQAKEQATGAVKASYASTMVDKIAELATSYSAKSQGADMVIRLNIDEKESILVGLKEQGGKVVVEVKAASEAMTNTLQLHKDAITRQLEAKNIYTTIHVESDAQENARNYSQQKERQNRNANKGTQEEFGGILDTLA